MSIAAKLLNNDVNYLWSEKFFYSTSQINMGKGGFQTHEDSVGLQLGNQHKR